MGRWINDWFSFHFPATSYQKYIDVHKLNNKENLMIMNLNNFINLSTNTNKNTKQIISYVKSLRN